MVAVKWTSDPKQQHRKTLQRFSERIQNSGVCAYPPLEAHLHEFYQKQKNPTVEPSAPEKIDLPLDEPNPEAEAKNTETESFQDPENQIQKHISENMSSDISEGKKVLIIGTQEAISNVVPFPNSEDIKSPSTSPPLAPPLAKVVQPAPALAETLDQQWQQLPAQVRYEQNLYRLFMQKVMENGDCSYPGLHRHIVQRYEAIHQDYSGRKMRWL
ncbi:MAG: hypothetical protein MH252_11425 [Thermosynechococcaceae cyanobacterium MS004]|nr:hypothetical protein [Thermosynechococcaceae cyanobacterium MS004]